MPILLEGCPKNIAIPKYFTLHNTEKQSLYTGFSTEGVYYSNYIKTHGKASDCNGHKQHERNFSQHIKNTKHLKDVADMCSITSFPMTGNRRILKRSGIIICRL